MADCELIVADSEDEAEINIPSSQPGDKTSPSSDLHFPPMNQMQLHPTTVSSTIDDYSRVDPQHSASISSFTTTGAVLAKDTSVNCATSQVTNTSANTRETIAEFDSPIALKVPAKPKRPRPRPKPWPAETGNSKGMARPILVPVTPSNRTIPAVPSTSTGGEKSVVWGSPSNSLIHVSNCAKVEIGHHNAPHKKRKIVIDISDDEDPGTGSKVPTNGKETENVAPRRCKKSDCDQGGKRDKQKEKGKKMGKAFSEAASSAAVASHPTEEADELNLSGSARSKARSGEAEATKKKRKKKPREERTDSVDNNKSKELQIRPDEAEVSKENSRTNRSKSKKFRQSEDADMESEEVPKMREETAVQKSKKARIINSDNEGDDNPPKVHVTTTTKQRAESRESQTTAPLKADPPSHTDLPICSAKVLAAVETVPLPRSRSTESNHVQTAGAQLSPRSHSMESNRKEDPMRLHRIPARTKISMTTLLKRMNCQSSAASPSALKMSRRTLSKIAPLHPTRRTPPPPPPRVVRQERRTKAMELEEERWDEEWEEQYGEAWYEMSAEDKARFRRERRDKLWIED